MAGPLRVGVIGCGSALRGSYRKELDRLRLAGRIQPVVACDPKPELADEMRSTRFGFARFTTDPAEVLHAADVDLVLITTGNQLHGSLGAEALRAGKHVLLEKPMSVDLAEARALAELAATAPGILLPAPYVILSPTFQRMWRRIRRGEIGRPLSARALYGWAGPDWSPFFYRPGGGALFDLGIYSLTALTGLLGPARRVSAMVGTAVGERVVRGRPMTVQADDNAQVLMEFDGACYAVATTGFTIQRSRTPALEVYGSEGTVQMHGATWSPDGYELWRNARGSWEMFEEEDPSWFWTDGLRHLVECVETGQPPLVRTDHTLHVLEVIEAARVAARDGVHVPIGSTFEPLALEPADGEADAILR